MLSSPLRDARVSSDAFEAEHDGGAPRVHSTVAEEYHTATSAVALVDRSAMGRLHLTGADALDLLNRLSTNKLNDLQPGQGLYTVVTNNKGRIVDLLFLLRLEDRLLALTSPQAPRVISDWIDFYTFVEDVSVEDYSNESAMLGLVGPGAGGLLDIVSDSQASELPSYGAAKAAIGGVDVLIVRTDFLGGPGYDLVLPAGDKERMREELLDAGSGCGLKPMGSEAQEVLRIERGVPGYGRELTQEFNPLEANLRGYVSFNKECYIGQEVVARLNTYDKVQKHLVGLTWEREYDPPPKADLEAGGGRVGTLTSAAASPRSPGRIGLGYVRKRHATPGSLLKVVTEDDEVEARVREFLK